MICVMFTGISQPLIFIMYITTYIQNMSKIIIAFYCNNYEQKVLCCCKYVIQFLSSILENIKNRLYNLPIRLKQFCWCFTHYFIPQYSLGAMIQIWFSTVKIIVHCMPKNEIKFAKMSIQNSVANCLVN